MRIFAHVLNNIKNAHHHLAGFDETLRPLKHQNAKNVIIGAILLTDGISADKNRQIIRDIPVFQTPVIITSRTVWP